MDEKLEKALQDFLDGGPMTSNAWQAIQLKLADEQAEMDRIRADQEARSHGIVIAKSQIWAGDMVYQDDEGNHVRGVPGMKNAVIGISLENSRLVGYDDDGNPIYQNRVLISGGISLVPDSPFSYVPPPEIIYPEASWTMKLRQEYVYWRWRIEEAWRVLWNK